MNRWLLRAIWIPSLLVLVGTTVLFAKVGPPVIPPAALKSVALEDKSLALQAPGNWKPRMVSSHSVQSSIVFKPDKPTLFDLSSDLSGSLMADISRASGDQAAALQGLQNLPGMSGSAGMLSNDPRKNPLEKLHDRQKEEIGQNYLEYEEAKTMKIKVAGQEALQTEFKGRLLDLWNQKEIVGMRISALTGERRLSIEYRCLETRKKDLFPVFAKMVKSVQVGQ